MKKKHRITLAAVSILMTAFLLESCTPIELGLYKVFGHGDSVDKRESKITEVRPPLIPNGNFSFIVTSDVHFGNKGYARADNGFFTKLREIKNTANPPPSFCICLGDVVEHGYKKEFEEYNSWAAQVKNILGNDVYTVVGNHDLYNEGWNFFKKLVFPNTSLFHFTVNGYSFYFFDTGSGSMGQKQYKMLRDAIEADSFNKILSTHYPIYGTPRIGQNYYTLQNTEEADSLMTLCQNNNVKLYLSGHMHVLNENNLGTFKELVLPCYAEHHQFALVTVDAWTNTTTEVIYSYY